MAVLPHDRTNSRSVGLRTPLGRRLALPADCRRPQARSLPLGQRLLGVPVITGREVLADDLLTDSIPLVLLAVLERLPHLGPPLLGRRLVFLPQLGVLG